MKRKTSFALTETALKKLAQLAAVLGVSMSAVLEMLIRKEPLPKE